MLEQQQEQTSAKPKSAERNFSKNSVAIEDNRMEQVAQRKLKTTLSNSSQVVQRVGFTGTVKSTRNYVVVNIKNDVIVNVKTKRIPSPKLEGDHTTAYITFQHMLAAFKGNTLINVNVGIDTLIDELMRFPGFKAMSATKKAQLVNIQATSNATNYATNPQSLADHLFMILKIRNQFMHSKRGKASGGKAESTNAGGLLTFEQTLEAGKPSPAGDPKVNSAGLFDLHVFSGTKTETLKMEIEQHQLQMESSYPHVFGAGGQVDRKDNVDFLLAQHKKDLKGHDIDYSKLFK